jgi:hypothetical protein
MQVTTFFGILKMVLIARQLGVVAASRRRCVKFTDHKVRVALADKGHRVRGCAHFLFFSWKLPSQLQMAVTWQKLMQKG